MRICSLTASHAAADAFPPGAPQSMKPKSTCSTCALVSESRMLLGGFHRGCDAQTYTSD